MTWLPHLARSGSGDGGKPDILPTMNQVPLGFVLAFFGLGILLRAWLHRRRHGSFGIVLFAGSAEQKIRDALLLVLFWDNRVVLLGSFSCLFFVIAGLAYLALKRLTEAPENPFSTSIAELEEDLRRLHDTARK